MPDPNATLERPLAVCLAGVAGFVDVVGYLTLHRLFTAHMTGNASKLGIALGRGDLGAAAPLAVAPLLFVAGVAAGTLLLDAGSRRLVLALQAALVAAYMGYGSTVIRHGAAPDHAIGGFWVLVVLATLALGLQTAALTRVGGETTRTTYVSGMLTRLGQGIARRLAGGGPPAARLALIAALWLLYVAGATLAAWLLPQVGIWCLAVPLGVLVAAAGVSRPPDRTRDAA